MLTDGDGGISLDQVPVVEGSGLVDSVSDSGVQCDTQISLRKILAGEQSVQCLAFFFLLWVE